ncbi:MAG: hypothetical protein V1874_13930 [Spirochaetota bacterium]
MEEKTMNRRSGPDNILRLMGSIDIFSKVFIVSVLIFLWILLGSIFIISYAAKIADYQFQMPANIDKVITGYAIYFFILILIVSIAGFVLNTFRHHRKTDKYKKSFIIFGILSFTGIIFHLLFF